jgi:hypothetical protein
MCTISQLVIQQQAPPPTASETGPTPEECFYSLLGMAEYFRCAQPPRHRLTIHYLTVCAQAELCEHAYAGGHAAVGRAQSTRTCPLSSGKNTAPSHTQRRLVTVTFGANCNSSCLKTSTYMHSMCCAIKCSASTTSKYNVLAIWPRFTCTKAWLRSVNRFYARSSTLPPCCRFGSADICFNYL